MESDAQSQETSSLQSGPFDLRDRWTDYCPDTVQAVVFEGAGRASLQDVSLKQPGDADLVIETEFSGISSGTEKLLWSGEMPPFPGMGYPLVPGYEAVGRVIWAGPSADVPVGARVFVPGSHGFEGIHGLFGGTASHLVSPSARVTQIDDINPSDGILLALAATAQHAISVGGLPDLIVGHGVLGRLIARLSIAQGGRPVVWETDASRRDAVGYSVIDPATNDHSAYGVVCDASGDSGVLDTLVSVLARQGVIVLAGFYPERPSFDFAPAFIKEAQIRIAAEWQSVDLENVLALIRDGRLSMDGLVTNQEPPGAADRAYRTAFGDPKCLKMIIEWRPAT